MKTTILLSLMMSAIGLLSGSAFAQEMVRFNPSQATELRLHKDVVKTLYRTENYQDTCHASRNHLEPCGYVAPMPIPYGSYVTSQSCFCSGVSISNGRTVCISYVSKISFTCNKQRTVAYGTELLYSNSVLAQMSHTADFPASVDVIASVNEQNVISMSTSNSEYLVTAVKKMSVGPRDMNKDTLTTGTVEFAAVPMTSAFGSFDGTVMYPTLASDDSLTLTVPKNGIKAAPGIYHLELSFDGVFGGDNLLYKGAIDVSGYTVSDVGSSFEYRIDLKHFGLNTKKLRKRDSRVKVAFEANQLLPFGVINSMEVIGSVLNKNSTAVGISK